MKAYIKYFSLIITMLLFSSCASFVKSRPGWNTFENHIQEQKVKLYVKSVGKGPPVILLHGFAASGYTWRHLVPELSKNHTLYIFDLKGFGQSPKPDDNSYSIYHPVP